MKSLIVTVLITIVLLLFLPFIKNFLYIYNYNIPIIFLFFIPFLIFFFLELIYSKQMKNYEYKLLQIFYFIFLFIFLFLGRGEYDHQMMLQPFSMLNDLYTSEGFFNKILVIFQILLNIIVFTPLGIWIRDLNTGKIKYTLILFIPLFIESIQYIFERGVFDMGDIVLNVIGIVIGLYLYNYFKHIKIK